MYLFLTLPLYYIFTFLLNKSCCVNIFDQYVVSSSIHQHNVPSHTMNVMSVWDKNITGAGVVVTILDDGKLSSTFGVQDSNPQ